MVGSCTFNSLYKSAKRGTAKVTKYERTITTITTKMLGYISTFFRRLKNELVVFWYAMYWSSTVLRLPLFSPAMTEVV